MLLRSITLTIGTAATLVAGGMLAGAQTVGAKPKCQHMNSITAHIAETGYKMSSSEAVVMNLAGTTPISNWSMSAHGILGTARMTISPAGQLLAINGLEFSLPVHNLRGEHKAMDEHAYQALKADQYKDITFQLRSATIEPHCDQGYLVFASGTLTVAGVTRAVTLAMHSNTRSDGSITFRGSENLHMSDYNVERPSLLFGAIKARDEMTLTYTLIFTK